MSVKVYYDAVSKDIVATVDNIAATHADYSNYNYVVCDVELLSTKTVPSLDVAGNEVQVRGGVEFPLNDINKLKKIAAQTIDYWRERQQTSGYTHSSGVVYGSDERIRALCMGKIQEMQILNSVSGIFPDINGAPVTHTLTEMEAVGTGMAHKIQNDYLAAVNLTGQLYNASITTLGDIEALLAPVLGVL